MIPRIGWFLFGLLMVGLGLLMAALVAFRLLKAAAPYRKIVSRESGEMGELVTLECGHGPFYVFPGVGDGMVCESCREEGLTK